MFKTSILVMYFLRSNMEHAYVSKIANEERQQRLDYRPIIEHDGLLWQRSRNQVLIIL